jgi:hypothetical protein
MDSARRSGASNVVVRRYWCDEPLSCAKPVRGSATRELAGRIAAGKSRT